MIPLVNVRPSAPGLPFHTTSILSWLTRNHPAWFAIRSGKQRFAKPDAVSFIHFRLADAVSIVGPPSLTRYATRERSFSLRRTQLDSMFNSAPSLVSVGAGWFANKMRRRRRFLRNTMFEFFLSRRATGVSEGNAAGYLNQNSSRAHRGNWCASVRQFRWFDN